MHGGFMALRSACPMNLGKRFASARPGRGSCAGMSPASARSGARRASASACKAGGPFLYGAFSAADAMFAPVATRLETYGIPVDPVSATIWAPCSICPPIATGSRLRSSEPWIVDQDEIDEPAIANLRQS
jgi:glutathione S-transferase